MDMGAGTYKMSESQLKLFRVRTLNKNWAWPIHSPILWATQHLLKMSESLLKSTKSEPSKILGMTCVWL